MSASLVVAALALLWVVGVMASLSPALLGVSESALERELEERGRLASGRWIFGKLEQVEWAVAFARTAGRIGFTLLVIAIVAGFEEPLTLGRLLAAWVLSVAALWLFTSVVAGAFARHAPAGTIASSLPILRLVYLPLAPVRAVADFVDGLVARLLGAGTDDERAEEELVSAIEDTQRQGLIDEQAATILGNAVEFGDTTVGAIMTPRMDIYSIDLEEDDATVRAQIAESPHTRVVVCRGGLEHILGVLRVGDLLRAALRDDVLRVEDHLSAPVFLPETISTTQLLETFRRERVQFGLIVDEYGDLQGLVTLTDVLTAIVGELPEPDTGGDSDVVQRDDGSWLVDGSVGLERLKAVLEIDELPAEEERSFHTVGGFAMHRLGRIPSPADHFEASGFRFEVVDMDRNRVDKVLVARLPEAYPDPSDEH